jgi:hypothetical protein
MQVDAGEEFVVELPCRLRGRFIIRQFRLLGSAGRVLINYYIIIYKYLCALSNSLSSSYKFNTQASRTASTFLADTGHTAAQIRSSSSGI